LLAGQAAATTNASSIGTVRSVQLGPQTSTLQIKGLTPTDLRRIDSALRRSAIGYARELRAVMWPTHSSVHVSANGEWRDAHFVERHPEIGEPALTPTNAKTTNNRARGRERTPHLGRLSR
jgi:hypothetical protein